MQMVNENINKTWDEIYKLLVDIKDKRVPSTQKPLDMQGSGEASK